MFRFSNYPNTVVGMFTTLCLSQVKEQLPENLVYLNGNPPSFMMNGHLFAFTDNQTFISSDPHPGCGFNLHFNYSYN